MKITAKEATYIQGFKKGASIRKALFYNWELTSCESDGLLMTGKFNPVAKVLLFPIVLVFGFILCIVDGGLKEYPTAIHEVFSNPMGAREYPNTYNNSRYFRMKKIYDSKK